MSQQRRSEDGNAIPKRVEQARRVLEGHQSSTPDPYDNSPELVHNAKMTDSLVLCVLRALHISAGFSSTDQDGI
jgi:hypothetical protein